MIYIINKTAVFSFELKRLSLYQDNESYVMLSNQATRLLVELIQKNGITLTREHLLKKVWEDYGATPSNNNLYMAVSELRKAFRHLGMTEEFIITIPKTGFLFETEIDIPHENFATSVNSSISPESSKLSCEPKKGKRKKTLLLLLILISTFVICLIIITYILEKEPKEINKNHISLNFSLDKCTFFSLGKKNEGDREWITSFIQSDQAKTILRIDCEKTTTAVYYKKMLQPINESFITACTMKSISNQGGCINMRAENN